MKRLSNLLAALVFASLVIFMSCGGGGDDPGRSTVEIAVENLTVNGAFTNPTTVQSDADGDVTSDWSGFTITFQGTTDGGSYTVGGVPPGFTDVWANGTWTISDDARTITKVQDTSNGSDTQTAMVASIAEGSLTLEFDVAAPAARVNGIEGGWVFVFN